MPGPQASTEAWSDAYVRAFQHIKDKTPGYQPANYVLIYVERDGRITKARLN